MVAALLPKRYLVILCLCALALAAQGMRAQVTPAPSISRPTAIVVINADDYLIQGTADIDSLVRIYEDQNDNGVVDPGVDTVVASQQLTGGATAFGIPTPLAQNADNNFVATAEVSGSTESSPVDVLKIIEDSSVPAVPVITDPAGQVSTDGGPYTITGTAEADSLVRVYHDQDRNGVVSSYDTLSRQQQLIAGGTDFAIDVWIMCEIQNFVVTSTDASGNESAAAVPDFRYTGECSGGRPGPQCSTGESSSLFWLGVFVCVALIVCRRRLRERRLDP